MSISLSSPAQNALNAILSSGRDIQTTQNRLATGLKVASAADGPAAFFTARGLNNRAADFSERFDKIQQGMKTVDVATKALDSLEAVVGQMQGLADQARGTQDSGVRGQLQAEFNELRTQIGNIVRDATYNGVNLINGEGSFNVQFSEDSSSSFNIASFNGTVSGTGSLNITTPAASAWAGTGFAAAIGSAISNVESALSSIRRGQTAFATATGLLNTRASFTEDMMQTLRAGADQLTVADMDEEGARLASLNVRGQLAQTTLGLAIQREQSILRLLG